MTEDEARIFLLEDALHQAASTIEFMHGCLTNPVFVYAYPDHTLEVLSKFEELVGRKEYCVHSRHQPNCESCQRHIKDYATRQEAKNVLPSR